MSELGGSVNVKGYNGDVAILETDKDLLVEFHKGKVINAQKSKEAQMPIWDNADFCRIIRPGEPHSVWDQPVREIDKYRFADKWKAYRENVAAIASGTPLEIIFPDNPAMVATLKGIHVHTVQALAELSDNAIGNLPFGHDLRLKAQKYIRNSEKNVDVVRLETQVAQQEAAMKKMEETIAALSQSKPRGRPPKAAQQES